MDDLAEKDRKLVEDVIAIYQVSQSMKPSTCWISSPAFEGRRTARAGDPPPAMNRNPRSLAAGGSLLSDRVAWAGKLRSEPISSL